MVPLEFLVAQAGEFEVEGDVFDLGGCGRTLGSSLSMILSASAKLDSVTSIYRIIKYMESFRVEVREGARGKEWARGRSGQMRDDRRSGGMFGWAIQ